MCSTEQNMRQSAFLQLPGELRNKIYECTLYEGDYRCEHPGAPPRLVEGSFPNRLSILCVCYQIHEEAALILFKVNTFRIFNLSCLRGWKFLLTVPQRRAITSTQFNTSDIWIQGRASYITQSSPARQWSAVEVLLTRSTSREDCSQKHVLKRCTDPSGVTRGARVAPGVAQRSSRRS